MVSWRGVLGWAPRPALIGYLILTLWMVGGFVRVEQIADRVAASDARQTTALRSILCLAQRNTLTSRQRSLDEKRMIIAFYQEALREVHAKPCDPIPQP